MPPKGRNQRGIFSIVIKIKSMKTTQLKKKVQQLHLLKEQKMYTMYFFITQKATNPCTQKRSLHKKLIKIGKDSTIKSKHDRAKKAIKNLIIRFIVRDQ